MELLTSFQHRQRGIEIQTCFALITGMPIGECIGHRPALRTNEVTCFDFASLFDGHTGSEVVTDILATLMSKDDYRITRPRTPTTPLKASFNGSKFVSLLQHGGTSRKGCAE
ncbi:MAG: hypothetical protein IT427_04775 [Pirellulales bacterium]|nr:hypothetical protein [Pirellulales bacterium]